MHPTSLPPAMLASLLQDALERDPVTARRMALAGILLNERYLNRAQLIARVEGVVGQGCFGAAAWEDTFYRDLRTVKTALRAAGHELAYSRSPARPGYYLRGEGPLSAELVEIIRQSAAQNDPAQLRILASLGPARRFRLGSSITTAARRAVAYRKQAAQNE